MRHDLAATRVRIETAGVRMYLNGISPLGSRYTKDQSVLTLTPIAIVLSLFLFDQSVFHLLIPLWTTES